MIRTNRIKQTLKRGGNVIGTFAKITDPAVVEILGLLGFDFFVLDNEHVAMNKESMVNLIRAAELSPIVPIIRVRENSPVEILQALDAGALGVQVPQVDTVAQAQSVVRSAKYAPLGQRGFAPSHRAAAYGLMDPQMFAAQSNEETLVVIYCETVTGLENLEGILGVAEVDVIFIGPFDLSQSLGVIGQAQHPKVRETVERIVAKTRAAGKAVGIIAADSAEARGYLERGVQYVTISSDLGMIASQGKAFLAGLRAE